MCLAWCGAMQEASTVYQSKSHHFETGRSILAHCPSETFLNEISAVAGGPITAANVAVIVAHPDDEAVGVGGQLARMRNVSIVHVTDGSPENLAFARKRGIETREAYAAVREHELRQALSLCGISCRQQIRLGIRDQQAAFQIQEITKRLLDLFTRKDISIVLTHPYEGGHPDHDATAAAVHAACAILAAQGRKRPEIIEMASYFAGPDGEVHQRFVPHAGVEEIVCVLSPAQRELKRQVFAAHSTQAANLSIFSCDVERFRQAPAYDFSSLPNSGALHYESFESGMTGDTWLQLACDMLSVQDMVLAA